MVTTPPFDEAQAFHLRALAGVASREADVDQRSEARDAVFNAATEADPETLAAVARACVAEMQSNLGRVPLGLSWASIILLKAVVEILAEREGLPPAAFTLTPTPDPEPAP
jgi:hypothetical protein